MEKKVCRRWTDEEKDLVMDKWGIWSISRLAKAVNRTEYAVVRFGEKNGLGSMYREGYLTTEQIADMFKVDQSTVSRYWIKQYGLKAKKSALKERMLYRVSQDDLLLWCENNQDKWRASYLEEYALGFEPEWLKAKRITDSDTITKNKGRLWTTKEIDTLIQLFNDGIAIKDIAEKLGRTYLSTKRQKERLGLRKDTRVA